MPSLALTGDYAVHPQMRNDRSCLFRLDSSKGS